MNIENSRARVKALVILLAFASASAFAGEVLPKPEPAFTGKIDASRDKSTPAWPARVKAPAGAPNVVLVLLDDVGFGAGSVTGGMIPTPHLERLAKEGLIFNTFHVTAMCSPTRAALLTGRNHHEVGSGTIADSSSGYPGYNSIMPKNAASIAEVLRQNGYSTAAFGKWHNTPVWELGPVGPFDRWPTGLGFEYFYGFLAAGSSQWEPSLYRNTIAVEPPATPAQGYNLTNDLATDAVRWLHQHDAVAPDKPFFLYFATSGTHTPHQAPAEWIAKFKGQFDQGWDKLREQIYEREKKLGVIPKGAVNTPRPAELPAWDTLTPEQRRRFAAQMELYAAYMAQTDHEVGRVLDAIREEGKGDNTLVLYIVGDNGASQEGGPDGRYAPDPKGGEEERTRKLIRAGDTESLALDANYGAAWAWAMNAPFQWGKQNASHLGGIRDPLIVSWPQKIKDRGAVRDTFSHVIDIAPTIYEAAGVTPPTSVNGVEQTRLEGRSLLSAFTGSATPDSGRVQYFEILGNLGIYQDGWFAGRRFLPGWEEYRIQKADPDQRPWELYHLSEDFSQSKDVSARHPEKLRQMIALFDKEARRNDVYPIAPPHPSQPSMAEGRTTFTYRDGAERIPMRAMPRLHGRASTISADVEVPAQGAEGVIYAMGGRQGGFSLSVRKGRLVFENNTVGRIHDTLVATAPLPSGKVRIVYEFIPDPAPAGQARRANTPGTGRLTVNGKPAGEFHYEWFGAPYRESFDLGRDLASPVSPDYAAPFAFTGTIDKVVIQLK